MKTMGQKLSRVAEMGWNERRTRLAQEFSKHLDLLLFRAGLLSHPNGLVASTGRGRFFFSSSELPGLISLLKERLPNAAEEIIREADEICRHRFSLLGHDSLDYGPEIDWHADLIHGKRAPLEPWFRINFLDYEHVGDHKIIWELNRHQHLVALAKACLLTGNEKYLVELRNQWHSWTDANPYPLGINWASSLEVALRSLSWMWVLWLLPLDAAFRVEILRGLARNGQHIERYLSTYFSPNTHLLGEATALLFIGILCTEIPAAPRWRQEGWNILLEEARRQVGPDGMYFERSLYYHVYALDFFLHARLLASGNGMDIPEDFDAILNRMLDVLLALTQAGTEGFGDDDGGRVFNPRRNRCEEMTDPLALGAVLFQRHDLKSAVQLTEEAVWLFGKRAISFFDDSSPEHLAHHGRLALHRDPSNAAFKDAGIYIMASGGNAPQQMVIDCGPRGTKRRGHGHAGALGVTVAVGGRRYIVDSGTLAYVGTERDRFRGTAAHNTLIVDGLDQAIPDGPFAWRLAPEARCEQWIAGQTFTLFTGSHNGYKRLPDPVLHRRQVLYVHGEFWFVRDMAEGTGIHALEIPWHFASHLSLAKAENGFLATPRTLQGPNNRNFSDLALLLVEGSQWDAAIHPDFVSPAYGKRVSSFTVRITHHVQLPVEHATLIRPLRATDSGARESGRFSRMRIKQRDSAAPVSAYRCEGGRAMHYIFFADRQTGKWEWKEWETDATFLCFAVENGEVSRFIFGGGTMVKLRGKAIANALVKVEHFEWTREDGRIFSSEAAAVQSFSRAALDSYVSIS